MISFIYKYRSFIIIFFAAAGILSGLTLPFLKTEPDLRNYIPSKMTSRAATDSIEAEFGVQDIIMILFTDSTILTGENLERIKNIDKAISRMPGISRQMSPFTIKTIRNDQGTMVAERLIRAIPSDSSGMADLKKSILENSFVKGVVFSRDLKAATITAFLDDKISEVTTLNRIDSALAAWPGKAEVITGGLPYIRKQIMKDVTKDALILVPGALLVMLFILKLSLKDWKSVLMPFSVVAASTLFSIGIIPLAGWKLSLMILLAPVILVAVANNYGIYLTARYQEISLASPDLQKRDIINQLTGSLNMPILFSGLTTIAGLLGLLTHSVSAARQVGILAASGVIFALIMSFFFIPAMVTLRQPYYPEKRSPGKGDALNSLSKGIANMVSGHPSGTLIATMIITAGFSAGIPMLRTDTRQEVYFPEKHPVRRSTSIISDYFGGSQTISVMIQGDIKDPLVMRGIDRITMEMENEPGIGGAFSISQVVREMSKAIYDPDEEGYDNIPVSREAIAQFFELYNMSGDPDDFSQIINFDNTRTQIMFRLKDAEDSVVREITGKIESFRDVIPAQMTIGGYAIIMSDFGLLLIRGQVSSLIFALLTVFTLLTIIFKSIKGGMISSVPFTFSILIMFGFMGLTGIAIDPATALLSSIMIGVGVDFTIQYIWCLNSFIRNGFDDRQSVLKAHDTIGRSIIINALSVMAAFSILILSGFTSIRFFGYLVLISIGSCLAGALFVIPAIFLRFRPRFILKEFLKSKT